MGRCRPALSEIERRMAGIPALPRMSRPRAPVKPQAGASRCFGDSRHDCADLVIRQDVQAQPSDVGAGPGGPLVII